jgi:hypothetical protein
MEVNPHRDSARFLFILSTERSGSTLLSLMLGAHSRIIAPPELHLLAYPTFDAWRQQYPTAMRSLCSLLTSCGLTADEQHIQNQFAGWSTASIYQWILAQENTRSFTLVDKTPKSARDLTTLQRTAQFDPFYVWLIRHPLGVAASQIALRIEKRQQRNTHLVPRLKYPLFCLRTALQKRAHVWMEVAYWIRVHTQIEQFLETVPPIRQHRVNFEQLVTGPFAVMDRLCRWLGITLEPAMLDPRAHIPAAMHQDLGDPKVYRHATVEPTTADSWRSQYCEQLLDIPPQGFSGPSPRELMTRWDIQ